MVFSNLSRRAMAMQMRRVPLNCKSNSNLISATRMISRTNNAVVVSSSNTVMTKAFFSTQPPPNVNVNVTPPSELTIDMAKGVQSATLLYIQHGLGRRRLDEIAKQSSDVSTLVQRWQKMMEAFLGTQVHVLAGLGYTANEQGIALYNQHLAQLMQSTSPDLQEHIRIQGRDLWREVLCLAFDLDKDRDFAGSFNELSIVDARNIMHKVSQRMQEPDVLEKVARLVSSSTDPNQNNNVTADITRKHTAVQEVLVHDVYLGKLPSSDNTLVQDCGFDNGVKGYVQMQCLMAEHQTDPLVMQYMGGAMIKLMQAAGIDLAALQQQQQQQQQ